MEPHVAPHLFYILPARDITAAGVSLNRNRRHTDPDTSHSLPRMSNLPHAGKQKSKACTVAGTCLARMEICCISVWSHRESNSDLIFRRDLFYPLNYETPLSFASASFTEQMPPLGTTCRRQHAQSSIYGCKGKNFIFIFIYTGTLFLGC